MDASSIDLVGSTIVAIEQVGEDIIIKLEPAYIIKTMTGSEEKTRWWQNGELKFSAGELQTPLPALPAKCAGGDVGENIYTYRDMIPIPLASQGRAHCDLRIEDTDQSIKVHAKGVELKLSGVPKYIEHLRG